MCRITPFDVSFIRHSGTDRLVNLSGDFEFTIKHACNHWSTHHHANITYHYNSGHSLRSNNDYSSIEYTNSPIFHYASKQRVNGRIKTALRGKATYDKNAKTLTVFENKNGQTVLNGDYVFPVLLRQIIENAKNGKTFYYARIFDGAENNIKYHTVTTAIGKPRAIDGIESWPISMAFFEPGDAVLPAYEMQFNLKANGIVDKMDIVYPHFTVRQTLSSLKLLEKPRCD